MIKNLYPTPIYTTSLEGSVVQTTENQVLEYIETYPDHFKHAWACNTVSNVKYKGDDKLKLPAFENELKKHVNEYSKIFKYTDKFKIGIESLWVNLAPPGSYQEIHAHTHPYRKILYSGVYYIKTEEKCGNIIFHTELDAHFAQMMKCGFYDDCSVEAKEGTLVLFPAWLKHRVNLNQSESDRIGISFNIELMELLGAKDD